MIYDMVEKAKQLETEIEEETCTDFKEVYYDFRAFNTDKEFVDYYGIDAFSFCVKYNNLVIEIEAETEAILQTLRRG